MRVKRNKSLRHTHDELVLIAERWLLARCGFAFRELQAWSNEIPDAIGFRHNRTIMIECKTSRADFFQDKKKPFRINEHLGVGDFRYFMCDQGLINVEDLPPKWGLLWVSPGGLVFVQKGPRGNIWSDKNFLFEKDHQAEKGLMYSALRRLHLQNKIPLIYTWFRE